MRHTCRPGLTLIECLVATGILLFAVTLLILPVSRQCCPISHSLVCASNLKVIGTSCKIYANDNNDAWPTPAFDQSAIGRIDYTVRVGGGEGSVRSPNRLQPSTGGSGGARQLSTTRAFWMLVRSGDITEKQFICPLSKMTAGQTKNIDIYYDFADGEKVSYGFLVPFGPGCTRATKGKDNRMAFLADRGPYRTADVSPPPLTLKVAMARPIRHGGPLNDRERWRPFNSPNHQGDGQNVLFADGHVQFVCFPTVGVDGDNIYTVATDTGAATDYTHGESPWRRSAAPQALSNCSVARPGTDSVIFP